MTPQELEDEARPTLEEIAALEAEADAKWLEAKDAASYLGQTREQLNAWRHPYNPKLR